MCVLLPSGVPNKRLVCKKVHCKYKACALLILFPWTHNQVVLRRSPAQAHAAQLT